MSNTAGLLTTIKCYADTLITAARQEQSFRLFDLADELKIHIIDQLEGDLATLRALALSCRRLQSLSEPLLYKRRLLRSPPVVKHFLHGVGRRPQRATHIQRLDIRCEYRSVPSGFARLPALLEQTTELQDLTLESPYCNFGGGQGKTGRQFAQVQEDMFALFDRAASEGFTNPLPTTPFQRLRKVELHLTGGDGRYLTLGRYSKSLFKSPTLQELTVSCVQVRGDTFTLAEYEAVKHTTPLKRLTLIECDFTMLSIVGNTFEFLRKALSSQQKSLEELEYEVSPHDGPPFDHHSPSQDLCDFPKLHTVALKGSRCPAFEQAVWGGGRREGQPPIRVLRISWRKASMVIPQWFANDDGESFLTWIWSVVTGLPSLQHLHFTFRKTGMLKLPSARRQKITAFESELGKRGVVLWLYEEQRSHCFPPYLYGEVPGYNKLVYASDGRGFDAEYCLDAQAEESDEYMGVDPFD
ncbi:hypothetical protein LTR97_009897 [Elasticomyces elasticus]|uniref:F-box domain-containing protein n=1 Tax=Elasticomyces elasticus TaxID=574655 RepID=A0AAN7ZZK9_9PEZI|nr:hypothetical protein LTR97_009897 [Elasticomyces elasticus]